MIPLFRADFLLGTSKSVEAIYTLWRSAQQGDLPAEAEASGTIAQVGQWSLSRADREQGGWIHIERTLDAQRE